MQLTHRYQVLTGVLPYDGIHDYPTVASKIKSGERPTRPRNRDANQWLRRRVWDMVVTCWSEDTMKRWEVHAVRKVFSSGNRNTQNTRNERP